MFTVPSCAIVCQQTDEPDKQPTRRCEARLAYPEESSAESSVLSMNVTGGTGADYSPFVFSACPISSHLAGCAPPHPPLVTVQMGGSLNKCQNLKTMIDREIPGLCSQENAKQRHKGSLLLSMKYIQSLLHVAKLLYELASSLLCCLHGTAGHRAAWTRTILPAGITQQNKSVHADIFCFDVHAANILE